MLDNNPYEKKNSANDGLDIPDFVEDNDTHNGPDMSIFNMSDEELYDSVDYTSNNQTINDNEDDDLYKRPKKHKSGLTLCIITILVLLATTVAATLFALKEHKAFQAVNTQNLQLVGERQASDKKIADLQAKIDALTKKEETKTDDTTTVTGGKTYEVVVEGIHFRNKPATYAVADFTMYNGSEIADVGDEFIALEVVKGSNDESMSFIKIAENVYICIDDGNEVYAKAKN